MEVPIVGTKENGQTLSNAKTCSHRALPTCIPDQSKLGRMTSAPASPDKAVARNLRITETSHVHLSTPHSLPHTGEGAETELVKSPHTHGYDELQMNRWLLHDLAERLGVTEA